MTVSTRIQLLGNVRRVVVKIGGSVLTDLPVAYIRALAAEVALLRQEGIEVVVISSGAISFGMARLDLKRRPRQMPLVQAAAAVGQVVLMQTYEDAMNAHRIPVAQVLLTHDDLEVPARFLRARHTLMALLDYGVVPVINENDSVAVSEIIEGDNDQLAARLPRLVDADLLVLLTTAEGIYATSPRKGGVVIPLVDDIDALAARVSAAPREGQRSLSTKLRAAQRAAAEGVPTVVASGVRTGVLSNILDDETIGTLLLPAQNERSRRKWIVDLEPAGMVQVSKEARESLMQGNHSLLAAGVAASSGTFEQGDAVMVADEAEQEFARGLVSYGIDDLSQIQGKAPEDIEQLLGYKHYEEVIRRDDLVIL